MVLIDLEYFPKLDPKQVHLELNGVEWILYSYQRSVESKVCSVKRISFKAKDGAAEIYGLWLGFSNSNLSSQTLFHIATCRVERSS